VQPVVRLHHPTREADQGLSVRRQRNPVRVAQQHGPAECLFQASDMLADGGLPHPEQASSAGKAAAIGHCQEGTQQVNVQCLHHGA